MRYAKPNNLCKIRRGFKIPQTKIIAYTCSYVGGMKIYDNDDEPYYHGKKDLINILETYLSNRIDLRVQVGTRIFVEIIQGNTKATFNFRYRGL